MVFQLEPKPAWRCRYRREPHRSFTPALANDMPLLMPLSVCSDLHNAD